MTNLEYKLNDNPIKFLCKGLTQDQTTSLLREFQASKREIQYLLSKEKDEYHRLTKTSGSIETLAILLSLSIFYRQVIKPIEGSTLFFETCTTTNPEIQRIRIGRDEFTVEHKKALEEAVHAFLSMTNKFSIPNNILNTPSAKDFLWLVNKVFFHDNQ
jgi:hypothetical protein